LPPWAALLATVALVAIVFFAVPWTPIDWDLKLIVMMLDTSVVGVAIPCWAVAMAGRSLSAISVSQVCSVRPSLAWRWPHWRGRGAGCRSADRVGVCDRRRVDGVGQRDSPRR
jgi:hypothetical protein